MGQSEITQGTLAREAQPQVRAGRADLLRAENEGAFLYWRTKLDAANNAVKESALVCHTAVGGDTLPIEDSEVLKEEPEGGGSV